MHLQEWQSIVSQFVGLAITIIFGYEAIVKVAAGAWQSTRNAFKQNVSPESGENIGK